MIKQTNEHEQRSKQTNEPQKQSNEPTKNEQMDPNKLTNDTNKQTSQFLYVFSDIIATQRDFTFTLVGPDTLWEKKHRNGKTLLANGFSFFYFRYENIEMNWISNT